MPKLFAFIIGWTIFCAIIIVVLGTSAVIRSLRLQQYLKKYHYEVWREITSIGQFGSGLANPFRGFSYLFKEKDETDKKLLRLKDSARISIRYFFIWFCTTIFTIVVVTIVMFIFQK